jgi:uncharacterized protein (DUF1778 family)
MAKSKVPKRDVRPLFVRMTKEEKDLINKAKDIKHFVNLSEWARTVLIREAKRTIEAA